MGIFTLLLFGHLPNEVHFCQSRCTKVTKSEDNQEMISHPVGTVGIDTACCFEYKDYWKG